MLLDNFDRYFMTYDDILYLFCVPVDDNTTINQAANLGMQNESAQRHCS
jgi:hypothetical protein